MADQSKRHRRAAINAAVAFWAAVDAGHAFIEHGSNVVTGPRRLLTPGAVLTAETWKGAVEVKIVDVNSDRKIDGFDIRTATYIDGSEYPWVIALAKLTEPQKTAIYRAQYESDGFGAVPAETDPQDIGRLAELDLIKQGYGRWPWLLTAGGCSAATEARSDRRKTQPQQPAPLRGDEHIRVALEELRVLRKMIEVPRQSSSRLCHQVERIEAILSGATDDDLST